MLWRGLVLGCVSLSFPLGISLAPRFDQSDSMPLFVEKDGEEGDMPQMYSRAREAFRELAYFLHPHSDRTNHVHLGLSEPDLSVQMAERISD